MKKSIIVVAVLFVLVTPTLLFAATLFQESFEDTNFGSRGWYDSTGTGSAITTSQHTTGSRAFECHFLAGGLGCSAGGPGRHLFTATDSVYVSFWIKLNSNWVGSGRAYHPHMIYITTDRNGMYDGPAFSHTTAYIELNGAKPRLSLQDGQNIDMRNLNVNLCNSTENRAVNGCNGVCDSIPWDVVSCYPSGSGTYWNNKNYTPNSPLSLNTWHRIEAYFQMNTITANKGDKNGIMRMWVDGKQVADFTDLIYRTGQNLTMKWNQFSLGPWIGDGSPVDQHFWIDDLMVATAPPSAQGKPMPPKNVQ